MDSIKAFILSVSMVCGGVCCAQEDAPVLKQQPSNVETMLRDAFNRLVHDMEVVGDVPFIESSPKDEKPAQKQTTKKKKQSHKKSDNELASRSINFPKSMTTRDKDKDLESERALYEFLKARCLKKKTFGHPDDKQKNSFHGPVEVNDGSLVIQATCQPISSDICSAEDLIDDKNKITCAQEQTLVSCFDPERNVLVLEFDEVGLCAGGAQINLSFVGNVVDQCTGKAVPVCFKADACIHPCMSVDDFFRCECDAKE